MSFMEEIRPKAKGTYIQAKLKQGDREMVAWVENKEIKLGYEVQLKDTGEFWTVVALYGTINAEALMCKQEMDRLFGSSLRRRKR